MKSIAIKYGLIMLAGFIGLFLLMHEVAQIRNYNLRILNGFIHIGLIYAAINEYRKKVVEADGTFLSGVAMGMYTSIIAVIPFAAFINIYLIADEAFMQYIASSIPIGETYFNPFTTSIFIVVEGLAVSLIGSYIMDRALDLGRSESPVPENQ